MRKALVNGDTVTHPRYGMFMVCVEHRTDVIPPDLWYGQRGGKQVTPKFYSERGLHFYLRRASWTRPCYLVAAMLPGVDNDRH